MNIFAFADSLKEMPSRPLILTATVFLLLLNACRDPQIESYRVPKEKDPTPPTASATPRTPPAPAPAAPTTADANMANTAVRTADGPGLAWTAPSGWTAKPASAMRKATFTINGEGNSTADLSITAFPGSVGGDLANINRWRGQVQLPSITEAELATATKRIETHGLRVTTVDFTGTAAGVPTRVLGAIVPVGDATWFFKLTGPVPLVTREQAAFAAFLQTIRPAGAQP